VVRWLCGEIKRQRRWTLLHPISHVVVGAKLVGKTQVRVLGCDGCRELSVMIGSGPHRARVLVTACLSKERPRPATDLRGHAYGIAAFQEPAAAANGADQELGRQALLLVWSPDNHRARSR
jgi:hypothetical protein